MRALLDKIRAHRILLEVVDGKLKMFAGDAAVDPALMAEIREHKEVLLQFLSGNDDGANDAFATPIPAAPVAASYPLSSAQRMLWVLGQYKDSNVAYNMSGVYVLEGPLDRNAFTIAFDALVARHESLRTVFGEDEAGDIRQFVREPADSGFRVQYHDLQNDPAAEAAAQTLLTAAVGEPFDLATGPLIRAHLCRMSADKWILLYVVHHIITDAWSMSILVQELLLLYNAQLQGEKEVLEPLRIQYRDYAIWQQEQLTDGKLAASREYWLSQLSGELPVLQLPTDFPRPPVKTYNGDLLSIELDKTTCDRLKHCCREEGATLFMGLLAAMNTLFYRYTGQEDIITGSPIAGRQHADLDNQIGFYINTLTLRSTFSGNNSFRQLLTGTKKVTLDGYAHQGFPFDDLIQELQLQRDLSRSPLFDVMIMLQNGGEGGTPTQGFVGDLRVSAYEGEKDWPAKYDITIDFVETGDTILMGLKYNTDLYKRDTITRMSLHFSRLLTALVNSPDVLLKSHDYLPLPEKEQLLQFSKGQEQERDGATVTSLFEQQAALTPDSTALICQQTTLTYRELNETANRLANHLLQELQLKADDLVGILIDRSADMIIAMLAVLKTGAAYVPVDADQPAARASLMLEDARALLLSSSLYAVPEGYNGKVYTLDALPETSVENPGLNIHPQDLAYVIYTSGSTGEPKGVMICHDALVDYVRGITAVTNIGECRRFGLVSTIAADLGNTVIFTSLLMGGALQVFTREEMADPEKMLAAAPDCLKIVPSHWKALQASGRLFVPSTCLIFGGELLTPDIPEMIREQGGTCRVYNHYGPSETTIGKLIYPVVEERAAMAEVPLGRPFCDAYVYLLDDDGRLVPENVVGEICIGGRGLARGYRHQPELTAERFVPDPFRSNERMYRTGDLGRRHADGNIYLLGRRDDQVKIRGYRIELAEITAVIHRHPAIDAAVVTAHRDTTGEQQLVAYIVPKEEVTLSHIRAFMSERLPVYMLPDHVIQLTALPLTPNGKVDRKQLPAPEGAGAASVVPYVAPNTPTEEKLVTIWQELLGRNKIGIKDNFFEMSGHSLKAIRLLSLIRRTFNVSVSLPVLFNNPTIEGIAAEIEKTYWANNELFEIDNPETFSI